MVKFTTFDAEKIRSYIEGTEVLEKGIAYMKAVTPGLSDVAAKEAAIRQAQQFCQQKWRNDTTGYIDSEYTAYREFANDVEHGRYFRYSSSYASESDRDYFLFILCLFLGYLGVHRFWDGRTFSGLLWLCTGGLFGIGWIVDCVRIWKDEF